MSIYEKALLVSLQIGCPPQAKKVKGASEEVEVNKKTAPKQAAVVTKLFAKEDVKDLISTANAARARFKELTLPWGRGVGLVPTARYMDFLEEMRTIKAAFDSEKKRLLDDFSNILANAATVNGDLFDLKNYPQYEDMRDSMYFSIEAMPVPAANEYDKLSGLSKEELAKLKEEAVISAQSRTEDAIKDLFKRMLVTLTHAAERLAPAEDGGLNVFKDTLLSNIHKAVIAAETLNITDDNQIAALVQEIKEALEGVTAADLRKDMTLRHETASKVDDLAKKIADFL